MTNLQLRRLTIINRARLLISERAVPDADEPSRDQILAWPEVRLSRSRVLRSGHVRIAQAADRRCQKSGKRILLLIIKLSSLFLMKYSFVIEK